MTTQKLKVAGMSRPTCRGEKVFVPPSVPYLPLSGAWLDELGFFIGSWVKVEAEPGRVVLTLDEGDFLCCKGQA